METEKPARTAPPSWLRSLWARLLLLLIVFVALDGILAPLNSKAVRHPITGVLVGVATAALALVVYWKLVGWLEQRRTPEIGLSTMRPLLLRGTAAGIGLFTLTLALILACNGYRLHGGSLGDMIATFGMMVGVATLEELLFRGVLFRVVEERFGTVVALAVSGLLFGGLHLINPDGTVWGALSIAVEGGLMLGAAYVLTRSLWLPIGLHLGWNFAESGIFGGTVSGSEGKVGGLLTGVPHGPAIISGGDFGPEASIFAILVCGAAAFVMIRRARRKGTWQ